MNIIWLSKLGPVHPLVLPFNDFEINQIKNTVDFRISCTRIHERSNFWAPPKKQFTIEIYRILCFTTFVTPKATQNHK